jgi:hypothetical protein
MSPEENYGFPANSQNPVGGRPKIWKRPLVLVGIVVVIIFVVLALLNYNKKPPFSITAVSPTVSNITTKTPSMTIYFNQPLSGTGEAVTSSPSIISGVSVTGDKLELTFNSKTLLSSKNYTITVQSISSATGQRLTNKQLSFTPTYVPPTFTGEDALYNIGLTTDQANSVNTYIGQFKPWAQAVSIDQSTIKHYQENPSDPWTSWAVSFTMNVDGTNYNVVGDFNNPQSIRVKVFDPASNNQLFMAGDPGNF